jgi:crossover junction endodeoxyribonuclease RuvC
MATVIGIDPSLSASGVCVLNTDDTTAHVLTLGTKGSLSDNLGARAKRLEGLTSRLQLLFVSTPGDVYAVIEGPAPGVSREAAGSRHDRSALWWDIVRMVNAVTGHWPLVLSPATLKVYATGKGNAGKDAVMASAIKRYLTFDIGNNNEADAVILAAAGARVLGCPVEQSMPQTHLRALAAVTW